MDPWMDLDNHNCQLLQLWRLQEPRKRTTDKHCSTRPLISGCLSKNGGPSNLLSSNQNFHHVHHWFFRECWIWVLAYTRLRTHTSSRPGRVSQWLLEQNPAIAWHPLPSCDSRVQGSCLTKACMGEIEQMISMPPFKKVHRELFLPPMISLSFLHHPNLVPFHLPFPETRKELAIFPTKIPQLQHRIFLFQPGWFPILSLELTWSSEPSRSREVDVIHQGRRKHRSTKTMVQCYRQAWVVFHSLPLGGNW